MVQITDHYEFAEKIRKSVMIRYLYQIRIFVNLSSFRIKNPAGAEERPDGL